MLWNFYGDLLVMAPNDFINKLTGKGSTGSNLPTTTGKAASRPSLVRALQPATTAANPEQKSSTSSALLQAAQTAQRFVEHRRKPLLVYLMIDLTASRSETREPMRPYEAKIAEMITKSGGAQPAFCKGVYHGGD